MFHLFLQHTSASLSLNENYDPDVQYDMEKTLSKIVPEGPYFLLILKNVLQIYFLNFLILFFFGLVSFFIFLKKQNTD